MGQYVKRGNKTYYKADDGRLYTDFAAANAAQSQTGLDYGLRQASKAGQFLLGLGRSVRAAVDPNFAADEYRRQWERGEIDAAPAPPVPPVPLVPPGPTPIVTGADKDGNVDRSQSDEYKSQMAQYRNLISQKKEKEAEDLGMKIWMQKYGGKLGLTGPNPLMADFDGFVPTQGPTPALLQASEAPLKAFGQEVKTYFPGAGPEGFSPLDAQDQQQEATAAQADMATTVKLPVRDRVARLRSQVLGGY